MRDRVLFICTHNSSRSQIAQAILNHHGGDRYEAFSAGTTPTSVRPEAIKVLQEIGIDTSYLRSKPLTEYWGQKFDLVVTVCDNAKESCPFFPGAKKMVHAGFPDPVTEEDFRRGRDMITNWIMKNLFDDRMSFNHQ
jgi:arsenate reductase